MKVGFVGLGNIGRAMATNLVRAGHHVVAYNRTAERARRFCEETGAVQRPTPAGVADAELLDAPVSGSLSAAEAAQLVIKVGGERDALQHALPVLEALGHSIHHLGPVGSGALSIKGSEKDLRLPLDLADQVGLSMGQAIYNASILAAAVQGGYAERDVGEVAQFLRETCNADNNLPTMTVGQADEKGRRGGTLPTL